jgi:hypothetical protein
VSAAEMNGERDEYIADTVKEDGKCKSVEGLYRVDSDQKTKSCSSCCLCYDEIRPDSGTAMGGIRKAERNS